MDPTGAFRVNCPHRCTHSRPRIHPPPPARPMMLATSLRRGWVAAMILCAAAATEAWAQPQDIAGVRVRLQPPAGFTPAARYPGFEHAGSGASIMVSEIPGPFAELRAGFTAEALASRGMTLRSSEGLGIGGREGVLVAVTQSARGTEFEKWIAMFGDDSATVMVTGTYPAAAAAELSASMRSAVLSAQLREGQLDPFEGLGFRVTESPRLRVATRVSNALLLNEAGNLSHPRPGDTGFVVGRSIAEVDLADLEAFSRRRLQQTATLSGITNVSGQPVTIDGIHGFELLADALNTGTSIPMRIYQVVLPEGSHYILIQGLVRADQADELVPEFRAVAQSLRRTP